jgi:hypothetical protein
MRRLVIGVTLLVATSFGYTLFTENFDAAWSTNNPPAGWRIFHTAPPDSGRDDWHREPANTSPWIDHPTPFVAIGPLPTPDLPPDSLISPTINCAGYRNVTLICSTYFYRWSSQPYIAKLVYSTDGGATWLYTLHDYYVDSSPPGPKLESLELDQATGQANVQLAWVYDGDINYIQWWSMDDISVVGEVTGAVETEPPPSPRAPSLSLDLFPNPCRDRVTIRCFIPLPAPASLTLYDASGRSVFTRPIDPSTPRSLSYSLDLRNFTPGIYVVRLDIGARAAAAKLVVR